MNASATQATEIWPLVAYFFLVVTLVVGVMALSYIIGERHRSKATDEPFESGIVTVGLARLRLSAKFYLIAMFFVIFDVEAVFLFAWAVAFRELGWAGYIEAGYLHRRSGRGPRLFMAAGRPGLGLQRTFAPNLTKNRGSNHTMVPDQGD